jgi:hypothetical protein
MDEILPIALCPFSVRISGISLVAEVKNRLCCAKLEYFLRQCFFDVQIECFLEISTLEVLE